jgi:hypothetical protein
MPVAGNTWLCCGTDKPSKQWCGLILTATFERSKSSNYKFRCWQNSDGLPRSDQSYAVTVMTSRPNFDDVHVRYRRPPPA